MPEEDKKMESQIEGEIKLETVVVDLPAPKDTKKLRTDLAPKRSATDALFCVFGGVKKFAREIWVSSFTLLVLLLILSAALFGIDITLARYGYTVLHGLFVLFVVRCLYLKFTDMSGNEDKIYARLTRTKG